MTSLLTLKSTTGKSKRYEYSRKSIIERHFSKRRQSPRGILYRHTGELIVIGRTIY